jgi:signal transduction histidine kinase
MLPGSHPALINTPPASLRVDTSTHLASAFSDFIATSSRLESSYRDLQREVCNLNLELAQRNEELSIALAENRRATLELEAGRNAAALAEVATILAHEIRNPLASLELFAELIQADDHRRNEWISNLRAGIRSLSGTVNNVLSPHASVSLKLTPLPLHDLITRAIEFMRPLANLSEITIAYINTADALLINGNESALQQVMLNLLSNAIRYTPTHGLITVTLSLANRHATLDFSDTGCGIRDHQLAHIFDSGFSGNADSCGLGLAVCARIIKQHGGSIAASNLSPNGARLRITLPQVQA